MFFRKHSNAIILAVFLSFLAILFFFPEPETNYKVYFGIMLVGIITVISLIVLKRFVNHS